MDTRSQIIDELDMTGNFAPQDLYAPIIEDVYALMMKDNADFMAGVGRALTVREMQRLTGLSQMLKPGTMTILAGNEGGGKTFFALECLFASYMFTKTGFYIPLEGRIDEIFERIIMRTQKDWGGSIQISGRETEDELQVMGRKREYLIEKSKNAISIFKNHISPPPGMENDSATAWQVVADEAIKKMKSHRVVIIDNLSFVSFDNNTKTEDQGRFGKRLLKGAQTTGSTCILINHTNKVGRKERSGAMTNDDISGSVTVQRAANCTLILSSHDTIESEVFVEGGGTKIVEHNKTIHIGKARHGQGGHKSIAYHFGKEGPTWEEIGIIKNG